MAEEFVGAGWAFFPMRTDHTGSIALVTREREIEEAIRLILATSPGERPMRPEFGCRIHDFVFAPADAATAGQIAFAVRTALEQWEPRVNIRDVDVRFDAVERGHALRGHQLRDQRHQRPPEPGVPLLHDPDARQRARDRRGHRRFKRR